MPDNNSHNSSGPGRIREFQAGSADTLLQAHRANELVRPVNAFLNLGVVWRLNNVNNPDGQGVQTAGEVQISDGNVTIMLDASQIPPMSQAVGSAFYNTDQSFTASCPVGTTGSTVTVTVIAGTIGSSISVSDANALALELATDRATNSLSCTVVNALDVNGTIYRINQTGSGLYFVITGTFTMVNGAYRPGVAMVGAGLALHPSAWMLPNSTGDVRPVLPFVGGGFIASGAWTFIAAQGISANDGEYAADYAGIALFDENGVYDASFNPGTGFAFAAGGPPAWASTVAFASFRIDKYVIGLPYISAGGSHPAVKYGGTPICNHIAIFGDGALGTIFPWQDNTGTALTDGPYIVQIIVNPNDNSQYILGGFDGADYGGRMKYSGTAVGSKTFVRLDGSASYATYNDAGTGFSGTPVAFGYQQSSGTAFGFVFAGNGLTYNGQAATHVLATDVNGNYTSSFGTTFTFSGGGSSHGITNIKIDSANRVYVLSDYTTVNGHNVCGIFRLTASGTYDTTFVPPASISTNGVILDCFLTGSLIYLVGEFTSIGGQTRHRIAILNTSGALQ